MRKVTFGFIGNPEITAPVNLDAVRDAIIVFLKALQTTCKSTGISEVTIVSGPRTHPVSHIICEETTKLGWKYLADPEWGDRSSAFYKLCDTLVLLGDSRHPWCRQQEELFRRAGGEVFICYF